VLKKYVTNIREIIISILLLRIILAMDSHSPPTFFSDIFYKLSFIKILISSQNSLKKKDDYKVIISFCFSSKILSTFSI
jgi:hypothetical protein